MVGVGSELGVPVPVERFAEHVFGVVILNDWSARDLQAWEYVPLGPFLGKSFATSISAWVLPLAALEDAAVDPPERDADLLPVPERAQLRLRHRRHRRDQRARIATCPYAAMYYTPAQMLAHLTVNGASLRTGDLFGSGTISGPEPDQRGSLPRADLERHRAARPRRASRTFLEDGDEVVMRAVSSSGARLGEVRGIIRPSPACQKPSEPGSLSFWRLGVGGDGPAAYQA